MVPSLDDHHILNIYEHGSPFVLCTDDKGVFETTLSYEYELAASVLGLRRAGLEQHAVQALNYAFVPQHERDAIHAKWFAQLPPPPQNDLEMSSA
jgi:adenosine deaminase